MILAYILKLLILVPLVAGLAYGTLWLWRRMQPGMAFGQRERAIKLIDAIPVGAMGRLAVVGGASGRIQMAATITKEILNLYDAPSEPLI